MVEGENKRKQQIRLLFLMNIFIRHWKEHLKSTLTPLLFGFNSRFETGEIEYTAHCSQNYIVFSFFSGKKLEELEKDASRFIKTAIMLKQKFTVDSLKFLHQFVLNLIYPAGIITRFSGDSFDEDKMLPIFEKEGNKNSICIVYIGKLILNYHAWKHEDALASAICAEKFIDSISSMIFVPIFYLYDSLTRISLYDSADLKQKKEYLKKVDKNQKKMKKWAYYAPMNFLHKWYLVEAEKGRILGKELFAMEYYDKAIKLSKENEYVQEEALSNELYAKFWLAKGKTEVGKFYLNRSLNGYERWGAKGKVRHLEENYSQFFPNYATHPYAPGNETVTTISQKSEVLDFNTVMKASQAISEEIVLEKLIKRLIKLAIENAGAQNCFLILENNGELKIEAVGNANQEDITILKSVSVSSEVLKDALPLPFSILHYVSRTRECIVLHDASKEGNFTADDYISKNKPKSVLCIPILNQFKLLGILYMENNLITGAFTQERLNVLNIISSQAAISIENARVYAEMEDKVKIRTYELKESYDKLEKANRAKSEFFTRMSHEIRTPLNPIMGIIELLSEENLSPKQRDYINILHSSSKHLLNIINDILDLSKIEEGKVTLENISFDLFECIKSAENVVFARIQQIGLSFLSEIESSVYPYRIGDPTRLKQILLNLLGNAIKFTAKGEIGIEVKNWNDESGREMILFCVRDTGIGISGEQQRTIFDVFSQGDTNITRKYGGSGLGLNITKKLVELMNGRIWVESEIGKGTKLYFTLNLPEAKNYEIPQNPVSTASTVYDNKQMTEFSSQIKILYAEDDEKNIGIVKQFLDHLPVKIDIVNDGKSAFEKVTSSKYDLVLMDMAMPVMSGYDSTRAIRKYEKENRLPEVPIIAITAHAFSESQKECNEAGCNYFISKPFQKRELLDAISRFSPSSLARSSKPISEKIDHKQDEFIILCAEDNIANRTVLSSFLEKLSLKIDFADNGEIALQKFMSATYDAVIMDINMPVMDGNRASMLIRKYEKENNLIKTPIIGLTANSSDEIPDLVKANYDDFIFKPFNKTELFKILLKYLKKS